MQVMSKGRTTTTVSLGGGKAWAYALRMHATRLEREIGDLVQEAVELRWGNEPQVRADVEYFLKREAQKRDASEPQVGSEDTPPMGMPPIQS